MIPVLVALALSFQSGPCDDAKLLASDSGVLADFGRALAADGSRLVVGSPGKRERAYVFRHDGVRWLETAQLDAGGFLSDNDLGRAVDLFGGAAILGGPHYDDPLQGDDCEAGVVMIFEERGDGSWERTLEHYGQCGDELGTSVAIGASHAAAGMPEGFQVLVFARSGAAWSLDATLIAPDGPVMGFGAAVDVAGERIAIGAPGDSTSAGAVYVFERDASGWIARQKIAPADGRAGDRFGASVALAGERLFVGVPGRESAREAGVDHGEVRVYASSAGGWIAEPPAIRAPVAASGARFGEALAVRGATCLVAAPGVARAYLLDDRRGPGWTCTRELASFAGSPEYAAAVALADPSSGLVGDPRDGTAAFGAGAVHAFDGPLVASVFCTCEASAPCGNAAEGAGCASSTGAGATLGACGSSRVAADDLVLVGSGLPPGAIGLVFMSRARTAGPLPFGDGLRCVGGGAPIFRFAPRRADAAGLLVEGPGLVAHSALRFAAGGHITPGDTWHFQCAYRDPSGPCDSGSNATSALSVVFLP